MKFAIYLLFAVATLFPADGYKMNLAKEFRVQRMDSLSENLTIPLDFDWMYFLVGAPRPLAEDEIDKIRLVVTFGDERLEFPIKVREKGGEPVSTNWIKNDDAVDVSYLFVTFGEPSDIFTNARGGDIIHIELITGEEALQGLTLWIAIVS